MVDLTGKDVMIIRDPADPFGLMHRTLGMYAGREGVVIGENQGMYQVEFPGNDIKEFYFGELSVSPDTLQTQIKQRKLEEKAKKALKGRGRV